MRNIMSGKHIFVFLLTASCISISLFSCKKERTDPVNSTSDYSPPVGFYFLNQPEEQTFKIDSVKGGPIVGKDGTRLFPDKKIFMHPDSSDFRYPYFIRLVELYTIKDMILANKPSVATDVVLETGGEIRVRAFQDFSTPPLVLRPGKKFHMNLDTTKNLATGMGVYYGFTKDSIDNWTKDVSSLDPKINPDTLSAVVNTPDFYAMSIARMGWVSCAKEYTSLKPKDILTFTAEGNNIQNIDIFISFNAVRSVMKVRNLKSFPIPEGTDITIIAIGSDVGKSIPLVYDKQTMIVKGGQQVKLNMQPIAETDLLNILAALK